MVFGGRENEVFGGRGNETLLTARVEKLGSLPTIGFNGPHVIIQCRTWDSRRLLVSLGLGLERVSM